MDPIISYEPFDEQDQIAMKQLMISRWKDVIKRFLFTFALPFICARWMVNGMTLVAPPGEFNGNFFFEAFLFLFTPVFFFIGLANLILFLKYIPSVHIDAIRKKKKIFQFYAAKYTLPEFNRYYIKTPFPDHPFFELDYDTYCSVIESEPIRMETIPLTKKVLLLTQTGSDKEIKWLPA